MASRPNRRLVVAARVRGRVIIVFGFLMLQRRQKKSEFEIDPNSLVDFDVTDRRSVSEWLEINRNETDYHGSFAQKVDPIWNEPVSSGSAGALARPSVQHAQSQTS